MIFRSVSLGLSVPMSEAKFLRSLANGWWMMSSPIWLVGVRFSALCEYQTQFYDLFRISFLGIMQFLCKYALIRTLFTIWGRSFSYVWILSSISLITGSLSYGLQLLCSPQALGFIFTIKDLASDLIPHAQFAISLKSVSWTNGRAHLVCSSSLCDFSFYCLFPVFGKLVFHVFLFFFPLGSRGKGEGISSKKINKISVTPHLPEAEGIFLCS